MLVFVIVKAVVNQLCGLIDTDGDDDCGINV